METRAVPENPYVYTLADAGGCVFYVGKGRGARMYQHLAGAIRGKPGRKNDHIRALIEDGEEVVHTVVAEFNTDEEAVAEENRLLQELKGLMNIAGPRKCAHRAGRARFLAALNRIHALEADMLPFHVWVRIKPRTSQDYTTYAKTIEAVERTKQRLRELAEQS